MSDIRRSVMLPTPAVWPTERLRELRLHIAKQDPQAIATMVGCYGPESPIKRDGELVTVRHALSASRRLDRWKAWSRMERLSILELSVVTDAVPRLQVAELTLGAACILMGFAAIITNAICLAQVLAA